MRPGKFQPRLMNQSRWLQRVVGWFVPHLARGESSKLVVDKGKQTIRGALVTRFNLLQQQGNVVCLSFIHFPVGLQRVEGTGREWCEQS